MRETAYVNRSTKIDLLLKADGSAEDLGAVTRMVIKEKGGDWEIDSDDYASAIDWQPDPAVTGKVILELGAALAAEQVAVGTYDVLLIVYDPTNIAGFPGGDEGFRLAVRDI